MPTPLCPEFAGQLLVSAIAVADQNGRARSRRTAWPPPRRCRGIDVRRIHPRSTARREETPAATGFSNWSVAVAIDLVLVIEDGLSQRLEQRHELRQLLPSVPAAIGRPCWPSHLATLFSGRWQTKRSNNRTPTQWCRRAMGNSRCGAGAATSRGESAQSCTPPATPDPPLVGLYIDLNDRVERSLATYGLPHVTNASAGRVHFDRSSTPAAAAPMAATPGCCGASNAAWPVAQPYSDFDNRPSRQPSSPAPPCAAAIPATTCATARWLWQRLGRALGARFQLTAQPCILRAQVPDLHRNDTWTFRGSTVAASNCQTLYLRLQGQRVLRRTPDRLGFLAGLDQLVSIGFKQSLKGTHLAASAWRHSSARASAAVVRTTSRSYRKRHSCGSSVTGVTYQASGWTHVGITQRRGGTTGTRNTTSRKIAHLAAAPAQRLETDAQPLTPTTGSTTNPLTCKRRNGENRYPTTRHPPRTERLRSDTILSSIQVLGTKHATACAV